MGILAAQLGERRRFRADEVLRMFDAGILDENDSVELVDGQLLMVPPQGPEHRALKDELHRRLVLAFLERNVHILGQGPVVAGPQGLPEPDLAVVRGPARDYIDRHPTGADLLLVIEIAKTSRQRDEAKAIDYARAAVPVYWLIDLDERSLCLFEHPLPDVANYRTTTVLAEHDEVELPELGVRWSVASLLR